MVWTSARRAKHPLRLPLRGRRPTAVERARGLRVLEKNNRSTFRIPFLREGLSGRQICVRSPRSEGMHRFDHVRVAAPAVILHPRCLTHCASRAIPMCTLGSALVETQPVPPAGASCSTLLCPKSVPAYGGLPTQPLIDEGSSLVERGDGVFVRYEDLCRDPLRHSYAGWRRLSNCPSISPAPAMSCPSSSPRTHRIQINGCANEKAVRSVLPRVGEVAHVLGY